MKITTILLISALSIVSASAADLTGDNLILTKDATVGGDATVNGKTTLKGSLTISGPANNATLEGSANRMPNQAIPDGDPDPTSLVATLKLADTRYLPKGSPITLNPGTSFQVQFDDNQVFSMSSVGGTPSLQLLKSLGDVTLAPLSLEASAFLFKTGAVGIGTVSPKSALDVTGTVTSTEVNTTKVTTNDLQIKGTVYDSAGKKTFDIGVNETINYGLMTFKNKAGDKTNVTFADVGNVGIGTATPSVKLDVSGDVRVTGGMQVDGPIKILPRGDLSMGPFTK